MFRSIFKRVVRRVAKKSPSSDTANEPKDFKLIPGPRPLPVIGNIWRYFPVIGRYSLRTMKENGIYNMAKYGKLVREEVTAQHRILHLFDPRHFPAMFAQEGRYPCRRSHRAMIRYRNERPELYRSGGVIAETGEEWARLRNLCKKHFLVPKEVNKHDVLFGQVAQDMISYIRSTRDPATLELGDFQQDLYRWALESICSMMLDARLGCLNTSNLSDPNSEANRLINAAHEAHEAVCRTDMYPGWEGGKDTPDYQRLVHSQDVIGSILNTYLSQRIEQVQSGNDPKPDTTLANFIRNPDVDRRDLFAIILDMVSGGIETTSISVGFTLYHLARNPEIQEAVRDEIISVIGCQGEVRSEHLESMKLLHACVKESLRLSPLTIGVGRFTQEPIKIAGYQIPENTVIITHNQVASLQEENYPDAQKFRPERWLTREHRTEDNRFLWTPFGHGPRMCLGRRIAQLEQHILLVKLLQNFRVEHHGEPVGTYTMLINMPDRPMCFRFVDR